MGWFWGDSNKDDPVKKLDPGLKEYLQNETPDKYVPAAQTQQSQESLKNSVNSPKQASQSDFSEAADSSKPRVPSASLFPDGRYAHLWKTYRPLEEVEGTQMGGAERVIEKYKERNNTVHKAAMENCALEHEDLTLCFQKGDFQQRLWSRMTMCSEANARFSRCFTTQAKFLQAVGYASSFRWDDEREEQIQMHADKLYHQMLDYEEQVQKARGAGQEPPPLKSLFNPQATPQSQKINETNTLEIPGGERIPQGFKPSKPLDQLTPHERELEIRAHNAQLEQQKLYVQEATPFMKSQEDSRQRRREKAVSWFGETIGKWIT